MVTRYSWGNKDLWFEIRKVGYDYVVYDQAGDTYGGFVTYEDAATEARTLIGDIGDGPVVAEVADGD
jgi:hypothetical protein